MSRELIKVGNRDLYGSDFTWVVGDWLVDEQRPADLMALERREWGNFYGYLVSVKEQGRVVAEAGCLERVASAAQACQPAQR